MRALSQSTDEPERASRPFDNDRDGFVLGEGAGMLVIESEGHAKNRGASILAELAGYGSTDDAFHITQPPPGGTGALKAMERAVQDAELGLNEIDYINAHGTSTPFNDKNESSAIAELFKNHSSQLKVSSTKSMTGHLLGAAAAIEAIFSIKALHHNFIPPTINIENLDPECDLDVTPNTGKSKEMRVAMSNAFGFGGTNASIIFQKID